MMHFASPGVPLDATGYSTTSHASPWLLLELSDLEPPACIKTRDKLVARYDARHAEI